MRLIDAETLKVSITRYCAKHAEHQKWRRLKDHTSELCTDICFAIDAEQTVEERKTGKWIFIRDEENRNALYECSVCHKGDIHAPEVEVKYCWNCGARMEE